VEGLSKKEIGIVSWLEFYKKYFFTTEDIKQFTKNKAQRYNIIKSLLQKKRIIKINRTKYYLVPIKAKSGVWSESGYIIADEICNSKDYFIGGWAAANYWRLTEQIPMRMDVYTTRRQGKFEILNARIVFHRTTKKNINKAVTKKIENHDVNFLNKEDSKEWLKSRV
jgi:predicted transcriptional regulator of viral defense system